MNRPRTPGRRDLPRWFRARRKGAGGYYIEHPLTRECSSLGSDKDEALALYWKIVPEIEVQVAAARNGARAAAIVRVLAAEPKGETLRAFLSRWREKVLPTVNKRGSTGGLSPKTAGDYDRMLRCQIEPLEATLIDLARVDAQALRGMLSPWLSMPHQYNYMRAVLSRALQHAVDEGTLATNPMRSVEPRSKVKRSAYITNTEYVSITAQITEQYAVNAIDLMYLLNMRPGDFVNLRVDALVKVAGKWCVGFSSRKTKFAQERLANDDVQRLLDWWLDWRTEHSPLSVHLIVHPRTAHRKLCARRIGSDWLSRRWREAADKAGYPGYHLSDVRPKGITDEHLAGNTGNTGGHETEQMRKHYQRIRLPERSDVTINLPRRKTQ